MGLADLGLVATLSKEAPRKPRYTSSGDIEVYVLLQLPELDVESGRFLFAEIVSEFYQVVGMERIANLYPGCSYRYVYSRVDSLRDSQLKAYLTTLEYLPQVVDKFNKKGISLTTNPFGAYVNVPDMKFPPPGVLQL